MSSNMDILQTMLMTWTDDEVTTAWGMIAEEGNLRKNKRTRNMKSSLAVGDKVSFVGRKSGSVSGTIVRIKTKKAIVSVAGQNWDVPLAMLQKEI
jgi:preprotein translocase subunit YajC